MEAMSEEEIRVLVHAMRPPGVLCGEDCDVETKRLIFTWAVAQGEAERLAHILNMHNGCEPTEDDCDYVNHDWRNAVLERIDPASPARKPENET